VFFVFKDKITADNIAVQKKEMEIQPGYKFLKETYKKY
jgi:hypothetical protein